MLFFYCLNNNSPLEQFGVIPCFKLTFFGFNFGVTNLCLFLFFTVGVFFFLSKVIYSREKLVPHVMHLIIENIYTFVFSIILESIGRRGIIFFPFLFSIFCFVLISNLVGLIPYTVTTTAQLMVSFGLGFSSFFGLNVIAYKIWGSTFLNLFLPPEGTPSILNPFLIAIELISYIFRVFSLSIRLFANMMAGHTLLKILSSFSWEMNSVDCFSFYFLKFIPAIIVFGVLFLEFGIGILQAYIFTVLLSLYLKDALFLH